MYLAFNLFPNSSQPWQAINMAYMYVLNMKWYEIILISEQSKLANMHIWLYVLKHHKARRISL